MGHNAPLELGPCNCTVMNDCPLFDKQFTVRGNYNHRQTYKGITEPKFKLCYGNHKKAFNHHQCRKITELSKEIRNVKDKNAT